jgi:hypothetical protein
MKSRWLLVAAGLVVCLAAGLVFTVSVVKSAYVGRHVPKSRKLTVADPVDVGAAEVPIAPALRRLPSRAPVAEAEIEAAGELARAAKDPPPEESDGISSEQYNEFVKTEFESQTPDPAWSRDAAYELTQSLVPLLESDASKATRVECRRDLCRFEVRNRDESAYRKTFETALRQRVWNAGFLYTPSPADPTTMIVYLAKKGESLPSPI